MAKNHEAMWLILLGGGALLLLMGSQANASQQAQASSGLQPGNIPGGGFYTGLQSFGSSLGASLASIIGGGGGGGYGGGAPLSTGILTANPNNPIDIPATYTQYTQASTPYAGILSPQGAGSTGVGQYLIA